MKKGKNRLWVAYICGTLILALAIVFGILHFHKRDLNDQYYQDERQIENTNNTSSPMSDEGLSEFLDQYGKLNGGPIPDWAIIPTNEEKKVAQKNEMIAFFQRHQEEMEQFAFHMKAMEDQDPEHTYLFAVKESALYRFDGVHIKAQEKITEHPILSEAAFFGHDESFDWVAWRSNWFEREACTFVGEVYDEHGRLYAELFLFYSEEKPVTNEYQPVESLGGNWYFYVEYRE